MGSKVAADIHHAPSCGCWLRCCSSSSDNNCRVVVVCAVCSAARCSWVSLIGPGQAAQHHPTLPTFYILFCTLQHPVHTGHHQPPPATTSHHTSDHKQWSVFVSVSFLQPPYSLFIDYTFPHNTFYPHLMKGIISREVNNCKYNCWNLHMESNP